MSRVHIGSGAIYLQNWVNVDIEAPHVFLASDRPDLVELLGTHEHDYYAKHQDKTIESLRSGPLEQECVCDLYGSFENLPVPVWDAEEVLTRHAFEHLSITEARRALNQLDEILKPGGILRIDVPDAEETLRLWRETGDPFYKRHLLGPRRDGHGFHTSYTRESLRALVEEYGFRFVCEEENIHFHPSFCLRFVKPSAHGPRDYALPSYEIPADWNVADIGPGTYPLSRANCFIDWDDEILNAILVNSSQRILRSNINEGLPDVADKEFDYVFCSHVLEHVKDPAACAKTLSRIAKRGTMVVPSVIKEGIFNLEEPTHRWFCLPNPQEGGPTLFIKRNGWSEKFIDTEVQKITCRLFRTGPNRSPEQQQLRNWFTQHERDLDIIVHWEGKLEVQVIG